MNSNSGKNKIENLTLDIFEKYPPNSKVTKLNSTLEIKQTWLFNEWKPPATFSKNIQRLCPYRDALNPKIKNPNVELIEYVFHSVRGQYDLWKSPREEGRWKKIEIDALDIDWVKKNVKVLYPAENRFEVSELQGIVLWDNKSNNEKRYQLFEGNHRISAWLASGIPQSLPATMYIGKPKKL